MYICICICSWRSWRVAFLLQSHPTIALLRRRVLVTEVIPHVLRSSKGGLPLTLSSSHDHECVPSHLRKSITSSRPDARNRSISSMLASGNMRAAPGVYMLRGAILSRRWLRCSRCGASGHTSASPLSRCVQHGSSIS